MKTLICVMAHKAAQETFNRHFQFWKKPDSDLLVAYPSDARVDLPPKEKVMSLEVGKAAHTGVQSIVRLRTILEHMDGQSYDRYAFFEYDSICLGPLPEMRAPIMAPVFRDNGPDRGFVGTTFLHPPIFFTPYGLKALVAEIQQMPMVAENSVWDRWLGLAIERAGMTPFDMLEAGMAFSDNTIHPARFPALARAVRNGVFCIHGVKDIPCLQTILEANLLREAALTVQQGNGQVTWKD